MIKHNIAFPDHFDVNERAALLAQLAHGRSQVGQYDGDWKSDFLLSDIYANTWLLRTKQCRKVNGEWKGAIKFSWEVPLCDGTRLTDKTNDKLRFVAQKTAFLVRFLPSFGIDSVDSHATWLNQLVTIIQWLQLHKDLYQPRSHLFTRVDGNAIADFMSGIAIGGKAWVLQYPQRCLHFYYAQALGCQPDDDILLNPFKIPTKDCEEIVTWLDKMGMYSTGFRARNGTCRFIDRNKLGEIIGARGKEVSSHKISAFLRQFEPDLLAINDRLLIPTDGSRTEYPTHRTPIISEVINSHQSESSTFKYLECWQYILRLGRHIPKAFPTTEPIDLTLAKQIVSRDTERPKHTPWVPLKTALAYTTESLRWIARWGEPLVDFYVLAVNTFVKNGWFKDENDQRDGLARARRDSWVNENLPDSLRELGIVGWTSVFELYEYSENVFDQLRERPSLNDVLQILVGAAAVLIGVTKPIRMGELLMLKRNCLAFVHGDGYWLQQDQEKANAGDWRLDTAKPIPSITARAIQQLSRLGDALSNAFNDPDDYSHMMLFYLPCFSKTANPAPRFIDSMVLQICMDRFCDYVALTPDAMGRRWYLRIHELRKSFLITFFWCFKFASLDAARWMAGQIDINHIYDYIQANFPGEELPQIEADYASQQLWNFAESGDKGETGNIISLYRSVCQHFGVTEINLIEKNVLHEWLELAFSKGIYSVHPIRLESKDGYIKIDVAFKIQKKVSSA